MASTSRVTGSDIVDTLTSLLLDPFQYSFMVRALVVSILVGLTCPVIGSFIVTRGLAFMGDALAHAVMPGLVVGFLLGFSPLLGAAPAGIAVALLIGLISRRTGIGEDTSIGILFAGMFAFGLLLLAKAGGLTIDVEDVLLGQVLGVTQTDVLVTAGLAALVIACLYVFHRPLVFTSFDPVGARVVGIPTGLMDYVLLALIALVIVLSVQAVGVVLVMAMLVTPAATAYLLVRRFVAMMWVGAALGMSAAVVGLYLSYHLDLPSGPAMALVATAFFALAALAKQRRPA